MQSGLCFPAPRGSRGVASVWLSQWWGQHFSQDRVVLRAFDPLGACEALSYTRVPVRITPLAGPQVRKQGERAGDSPQRPQGRAVSGSQLRIPEAARGLHRGCPLPPKKRPNSAFSCHQPLGLQLPKPPPPQAPVPGTPAGAPGPSPVPLPSLALLFLSPPPPQPSCCTSGRVCARETVGSAVSSPCPCVPSPQCSCMSVFP